MQCPATRSGLFSTFVLTCTQLVFYLLWGNVLSGWSFLFSSCQQQSRPAVLLAVVWVIVSGFSANLVLVQFVEFGPTVVADVLQIIPSFGLFRGASLSSAMIVI